MRNNEMHHTSRYKNKFKLSVYAYGENITYEEKETMKELVTANVINFNGSSSNVYFSENIASFKELKEAVS